MRLNHIENPKRIVELPFKKIAFFSLWAFTALAQPKAAKLFTLSGQLAQPDKGKVYLLNQDSTRAYSAPIEGSRFVLKGKLAEPGLYLVQVGTSSRMYPVFLEGSPIQMAFQKNGTYQVKGSSIHDQWASNNHFIDSCRNQLIRLSQARSVAKQQGDTVLYNQLWTENNSVSRSYFIRRSEMIARKPYTFFNLFLLKQLDFSLGEGYTINMLNEYRPLLAMYPTFQLLDQEVKKREVGSKKVAIGQEAYNFMLPDRTGATHSLATVRTAKKLVLVDFWASWCGPCIKEFPGLKALYEKYASQGLQVIGISIDKESTQWLGALSRLQPPGLQLIITDKIPVTDNYAIHGIPQTFLIDQKGIIRGNNLRGEDLDKKVAELLAETR